MSQARYVSGARQAAYLEPGKEDGGAERAVEDDLPVADKVETGQVLPLVAQLRHEPVDHDGAVGVERDAAERHGQDDEVDVGPDAAQVCAAHVHHLRMRGGKKIKTHRFILFYIANFVKPNSHFPNKQILHKYLSRILQIC